MPGRGSAGPLHMFTIAAAYVGAVVGGGFATGREVFHFFASPLDGGAAALIIASGGFILGGMGLMVVISRLCASSAAEIIAAACVGRSTRRWVGRVLTLFYLLILGVVFSAAGALADGWGFPPPLGAVGLAVAVGSCLLIGPRGIGTVNTVLLAVLALTLLSTALELTPPLTRDMGGLDTGAAPVAPVLYVSYNLVFAMAVFPDLAVSHRAKLSAAGAALGGAMLGLLCWAEWRIMAEVYRHVAWADVPLRVAVALVRPSAAGMYPLLVLLSLTTTGVAVGCGLIGQLAGRGPRYRIVLGILLLALPVAAVNLSQLVRMLYPPLGWLSLIFWVQLFWRSWTPLRGRTRRV